MVELIRFYGFRRIKVVDAKGQYVWDDSGKRYLDMHTGHGVAFLGHKNPHVVEGIKRQLDKFITLSTSFDSEILHEALRSLEKILPNGFDSVAFFNSGTEAVEFALKVAKKYRRGGKIIAIQGSFHGRTMGSLSVTWNRKYREPFEPLIPNVDFVKFNDATDVDSVISEGASCVILEPIQGESGVRIPSKEYLQAVCKRAKEVGALVIVDEIQTGFGRTGRTWAYQYYGIEPDILLIGKSIAGGIPVGIAALGRGVGDLLEQGEHGSTFGGNPLALAGVNASVELYVRESIDRVAKEKGERFISALREELGDNKLVREVRGMGLMVAVELRILPQKAIELCQDSGLLVLKGGASAIRFLPPYLITDDDIEEAVKIVSRSVREPSS